ncbi:MBL fold metallo-hydrolase [Campylobacter jejuni]|uniref:MBL fold metallo-hydrolase n=1 Tax=Campylobacter jejuni TaxID=197 RepID=UPI00069967FC|nr:MBL fold metallo-hydrolase [Campylobacter jejuni]EAH8610454.1 MBL fold metallo-hydrolase [Campylobacter jejuni]EAK8554525.1 MBL fold metallo-hydrolase [Campylobacter jejuni]EAK8574369.1 MBL fold metallo-hydrolase [Campylobacter jejuni]EAK8727434.1 MBL fold metallo-hydrolase [Campylobacter jejuni]EAM0578847.1 MBL fold metallo-hydrolase [Campylobacter jejuni]
MQIIKQACGVYETNCYILFTPKGEFIIDPGTDALLFIKKHVKNPLAILNTHGHYDHIWDNAKVKKEYNIPIYIHKNDAFMLHDDFNQGYDSSDADFLVDNEDILNICGVDFKFHFLPGHTPGCTMIEIVGKNIMFSGDFLFYRSIGRWDFPYSDANLMKQSLEKVMTCKEDFKLLPGHGQETTLKEEQVHLPSWLRYF